MPIYQYKCTGCGELAYKVLGIKEDTSSDLVCDRCKGTMKRYYANGAFGIQFNGSGWASKS
jgi:putative FmdB family regulatory protein